MCLICACVLQTGSALAACKLSLSAGSDKNGNHLLRVRRTLLAHSLVAFRSDMEAEGKMYKPK